MVEPRSEGLCNVSEKGAVIVQGVACFLHNSYSG